MRIIRWTSLSLALAAAALVTGCGTLDMGDVYGPGPRDPYYDRGDRGSTVQGTVERVSPRERLIVVSSRDTDGRYDLRNGDDRRGVVLVQYDSSTTVQFEGRRYEPANLERGDEVEIQARRDPDGLWHAQQIVVVGEGEPVRR